MSQLQAKNPGPRQYSELDRNGQRDGLRVSWLRHVDGATWSAIAVKLGKTLLTVGGKSTAKAAKLTVRRLRDAFAESVFQSLVKPGYNIDSPTFLDRALRDPKVRLFLKGRHGIPFDKDPAGSGTLVRELFPIGREFPAYLQRRTAIERHRRTQKPAAP